MWGEGGRRSAPGCGGCRKDTESRGTELARRVPAWRRWDPHAPNGRFRRRETPAAGAFSPVFHVEHPSMGGRLTHSSPCCPPGHALQEPSSRSALPRAMPSTGNLCPHPFMRAITSARHTSREPGRPRAPPPPDPGHPARTGRSSLVRTDGRLALWGPSEPPRPPTTSRAPNSSCEGPRLAGALPVEARSILRWGRSRRRSSRRSEAGAPCPSAWLQAALPLAPLHSPHRPPHRPAHLPFRPRER